MHHALGERVRSELDDAHVGPLGAEGGALLKLKADLAFLSVLLRGATLSFLLKANFDPNQLRDDRGRWARGGGSVRLAQADGTGRYPVGRSEQYRVNLLQEEGRGGHAIGRHVGKTDSELIARVQKNSLRSLFISRGLPAQGSFESLEIANDLVNQVLQENSAIVDDVASGLIPEKYIRKQFEFETGREAFHTDAYTPIYVRPTTMVSVLIRTDTRSPRGYTVITAFPRNPESPNERKSMEPDHAWRKYMEQFWNGSLDEAADEWDWLTRALKLLSPEERRGVAVFLDDVLAQDLSGEELAAIWNKKGAEYEIRDNRKERIRIGYAFIRDKARELNGE